MRTEVEKLQSRLQEKERDLESAVDIMAVIRAVNKACTCGGGPPSKCCPACSVFHNIRKEVTP